MRALPYVIPILPVPVLYLLWPREPWGWDLGALRFGVILLGFGLYITAHYVALFMRRARGPRWIPPLMRYFAVLGQVVLGVLAAWWGRWWMEYLPYLLIGLYGAWRIKG